VPRSEGDGNNNRPGDDLSKYLVVHPDDLVFNKLRTWQGGFGVSRFAGIVSPAYFVCQPNDSIAPRFVDYLLRSHVYLAELTRISKWMPPSQFDIAWEDLRTLPIVTPDIATQKRISNFLDRETAEADALVAKYERLIDLLEEKRVSLITQAVTKGLDPTVPMRDSGVDWVGAMPTHWKVMPLKRLVSMKSGEQITAEQISESGDYPVYGGNGLRGYTDSFTHDGAFALIGRQGALCGNINYANEKFWASEHAVVVTPRSELALLWLGELLRSMNLGQYSVSAAQPGLSVETIGNLRIPVPPRSEQAEIAELFEKRFRIDNDLHSKAARAIELIREHRSALITSAVTGQIDVANYRSHKPPVEVSA
jgi:type I restriction enzyme S subunit